MNERELYIVRYRSRRRLENESNATVWLLVGIACDRDAKYQMPCPELHAARL
ncbi:hypothetical protein BU16DRAFT_136158 [Lophium mytilinum]|uniref:Uncharacterized protein n=1 Tax=Lophium mytilinum TaxID=390894 RepID=A0A6A6QFB2_9PEZI|nr:hypothetical protein BU16DRAFT_136158 [Lophium mytilinum]